MYGQTEATARIAVLPPDLAEVAPGAIGRPVPGGRLSLRPVPGAEEGTGELVYEGPNVMLGYAETPADLALGRTTHELATGDLGRLRPDGLWEVVGRLGRVAKVLGLRLDLDRVERLLAARGVVVSAVDGGERLVLGVTDQAGPRRRRGGPTARRATSSACPPRPSTWSSGRTCPRLPQRQGRRARPGRPGRAPRPQRPRPSACETSTLAQVMDLYARALGRRAGPDDTFVSLGGDSLSYVEVSLRLEGLLGRLPAGLADLDRRRAGRRAAAQPGATRPPRRDQRGAARLWRSSASSARTRTSSPCWAGRTSCWRSPASTSRGSSSPTPAAAERVRSLLRTAARIAVPSMLVIAVVALWTEGLGWRQALLVNGVTSGDWGEPGGTTGSSRRSSRSSCRGGARCRAGVRPLREGDIRSGCRSRSRSRRSLTRYGIVGVPGDNAHRAHVLFWLFALGWAAARAPVAAPRAAVGVAWRRCPASSRGRRARRVRRRRPARPRLAARRPPARPASPASAGVLAAASLWIYLLHWQVYPHLEHRIRGSRPCSPWPSASPPGGRSGASVRRGAGVSGIVRPASAVVAGLDSVHPTTL